MKRDTQPKSHIESFSEAGVSLEPINLREIGLEDRPGYYNVGLSFAPAERFKTANAEGEKVTLVLLDNPVTEGGLSLLLSGIAPYKFQTKRGVYADWILPDQARRHIAEGNTTHPTVERHHRHERLPEYREFDEDFRSGWIGVLEDETYGEEMDLLTEVAFIEPDSFSMAMLREWKWLETTDGELRQQRRGMAFGYLSQFPKGKMFREQLKSEVAGATHMDVDFRTRVDTFIAALEQTDYEAAEINRLEAEKRNVSGLDLHSLYLYLLPVKPESEDEAKNHYATFLDLMKSKYISSELRKEIIMGMCAADFAVNGIQIEFIDPVGKRVWSHPAEIQNRNIRIKPIAHRQENKCVVINHGALQMTIDITQVDEHGRYSAIQTTLQPSEEARYMRPLIAFVDTPQGRRFLTKEEAKRYMPEEWKGKQADVMLGRVALAYLQPDVTERFLDEMPLPRRKDGHETNEDRRFAGVKQEMSAAQMPVWISLPGYARKVLCTDKVDRLAS